MSTTSYSVYPRYSPGSPGMVDARTAKQVAEHELAGYYRTLEGLYGTDATQKAKEMGLGGIIEVHEHYANRVDYYDRLTGEYGTLKYIDGKQRRVRSKDAPRCYYPKWEWTVEDHRVILSCS